MLNHSVIAIMRDGEGFVSVGYGTDPESALQDLQANLDEELLDHRMITFYRSMDVKIKLCIE
jgi:hypothetical protein